VFRKFDGIGFARAGRDDGQAMVEYALILAFVATVCAASLALVGVGVDALLQNIPGFL
jgi:Flp pilus assembly pilin Flp